MNRGVRVILGIRNTLIAVMVLLVAMFAAGVPAAGQEGVPDDEKSDSEHWVLAEAAHVVKLDRHIYPYQVISFPDEDTETWRWYLLSIVPQMSVWRLLLYLRGWWLGAILLVVATIMVYLLQRRWRGGGMHGLSSRRRPRRGWRITAYVAVPLICAALWGGLVAVTSPFYTFRLGLIDLYNMYDWYWQGLAHRVADPPQGPLARYLETRMTLAEVDGASKALLDEPILEVDGYYTQIVPGSDQQVALVRGPGFSRPFLIVGDPLFDEIQYVEIRLPFEATTAPGFSWEGKAVYTVDSDGRVLRGDTGTQESTVHFEPLGEVLADFPLQEPSFHLPEVERPQLAVLENEGNVLLLQERRRVMRWDLATGALLDQWEFEHGPVLQSDVPHTRLPDLGYYLVDSSDSGLSDFIEVWRFTTGEQVDVIELSEPASWLALSPGGRFLFVDVGTDSLIHVYDTAVEQWIGHLLLPEEVVASYDASLQMDGAALSCIVRFSDRDAGVVLYELPEKLVDIADTDP